MLRLELEAKANQESGYNAGFNCHRQHHHIYFYPALISSSGEVEPFLSSDTDDTDSDPEIQEVVKTIKLIQYHDHQHHHQCQPTWKKTADCADMFAKFPLHIHS